MSIFTEYINEEINFRLIMLSTTTTYRPKEKRFESLSDISITPLEKFFLSSKKKVWIDKEAKFRYILLEEINEAFVEYSSKNGSFQKIRRIKAEDTPIGEWLYDFHRDYVERLDSFKKYKEHIEDGIVLFNEGTIKKVLYWMVEKCRKLKRS